MAYRYPWEDNRLLITRSRGKKCEMDRKVKVLQPMNHPKRSSLILASATRDSSFLKKNSLIQSSRRIAGGTPLLKHHARLGIVRGRVIAIATSFPRARLIKLQGGLRG